MLLSCLDCRTGKIPVPFQANRDKRKESDKSELYYGRALHFLTVLTCFSACVRGWGSKGKFSLCHVLGYIYIKRGRGTTENGIQGRADGMPIHLWKPFSNSDCTHLHTRVGRGNMKIVTTNRIPSGLEVDLSIRCSA